MPEKEEGEKEEKAEQAWVKALLQKKSKANDSHPRGDVACLKITESEEKEKGKRRPATLEGGKKERGIGEVHRGLLCLGLRDTLP